MDNIVKLHTNLNKIEEKDSLSKIDTDLASLHSTEIQSPITEINDDYPEKIFKEENNSAGLIRKSEKAKINEEISADFIHTPEEKCSIEDEASELSDLTDLSDLDILSKEDDEKKVEQKANNVVGTDSRIILVKDNESDLTNLLRSNELSSQGKNFIRAFIKGEYVKNTSLPSLEISEEVMKKHLQSDSHYRTVIGNLPSSIIIRSRLTIKRKVSLKPLPELNNATDDNNEWVLQQNTCQKLPKEISRCAHCISKQKDQCRYRGVRMIAQDNEGNVAGTSFRWQKCSDLGEEHEFLYCNTRKNKRLSQFETQINDILEYYKKIDKKLPNIQREPITNIKKADMDKNLRYLLEQCSTSLKGLIDLQLDLFNFSPMHFKSTVITGQHQCDNCSITLLNIYFLNTHCGIELCFNCYLMDNKSNIVSRCLKVFEHPISEFIPVTVFPKYVIKWLKERCNNLVKEDGSAVFTIDENLFVYNGIDIGKEESNRLYRSYFRGTEEEIGLESYQSLMQQGIPFVVKDVPMDQLKYFGVDYLIKYYGDALIEQLIDSSGEGTVVTLQEFFNGFDGISENKSKSKYRKIKDWPAFSEFKTVFPKLYNVFLNVLPFKHCTQPNGSLNLASYLPQILNPPDLGPKMYIATGKKENGDGTTPLHLDAADAVNIMTHSYESGHERPNTQCAALWHLFDYNDISKIREYLAKWARRNKKEFDDYIHDQKIYLTEDMLKELKQDYGVSAYQIYQNPGDAVFIPAGCAHQVLNLSNCIKVATDFISPERTIQCMHIAKEFSKLTKQHHRSGDIVQTENHILYSCSYAISKLTKTNDELLDYTIQPAESVKFKSKSDAKKEANIQDEEQTLVQSLYVANKRLRPEGSPERKLPRIESREDPN